MDVLIRVLRVFRPNTRQQSCIIKTRTRTTFQHHENHSVFVTRHPSKVLAYFMSVEYDWPSLGFLRHVLRADWPQRPVWQRGLTLHICRIYKL